jgi:putative acetyltransferase
MHVAPTIRSANPADAAALQRYAAALFAERLPALLAREQPRSVEWFAEYVAQLASQANSVYLLAEHAGEVVGTLDFSGHQRSQRNHGGELGMSVAAAHRARGIGTALLQALFAWAPAHGVTRLELCVFASNVDAIRLYERLGFELEGRRRAAIRIGDGFIDMIEMVKRV